MQLAAVAERVFLAHGFADTTMQMIASRAGSSKETLYRHFACKEALFAEIVTHRTASISGPDGALSGSGSPEEVLRAMGLSMMRVMKKGDALSLFRIVVTEAQRSPQLAAVFYDQGPGATLERLTDYLRAASRRGQLRCPQPARAAKLFFGAVVAQQHIYSLIGEPSAPIEEAEMRGHVREAVAMFLARYGTSIT